MDLDMISYAMGMRAAGGSGGGGSEAKVGPGEIALDVAVRPGRMSPYTRFAVNGTATIDWGDGTTPDTVTGTAVQPHGDTKGATLLKTRHTYTAAGYYTIKIKAAGDSELGVYAPESSDPGLYSDGQWTDTEHCDIINSLYAVRMGEGVVVGPFALNSHNGLMSVTFPPDMEEAPEGFLAKSTAISDVTLPQSVHSVGLGAFQACTGLCRVRMPGATTIGGSAFAGCTVLTDVEIPDGVTTIETGAFMGCQSLGYISIPNSVTSLGNSVFSAVKSLAVLDMSQLDHVPTLGTRLFYNVTLDYQIWVPAALLEDFKAATNWSYWADHMVGV